MEPWVWIVIAVAVVAVVALAFWYSQQRHSGQLRERFGPEYERQVQAAGDRRQAEAELARRAERVEHLDIRALSPEEKTRFSESWRSVQSQFVDDPPGAISAADRLVIEVMQLRGYPMSDFEQRAADISVDHPHVVEHYRAAYAIARRSERGEANTEDLRQAMVHYRALFQDLLETAPTGEEEAHDERTIRRAA